MNMKIIYRYVEKAVKPQIFSQMIRQNLPDQPMNEIMHQMNLFKSNINNFDYDFYTHASYELIKFQKQLKLEEIITVLQLGFDHGIKSQTVWNSFENEFYHRLHRSMGALIEKEMDMDEKLIQESLQKFEANSSDIYKILTPQFIDQQQKNEKENPKQEQPEPKKSRSLTKPKPKNPANVLQNMEDFVSLLILNESKNFNLFSLLLQSFLHPQYKMQKPKQILKFAQLLTYHCQMLLQEYSMNTKKYLRRSIKKIYHFQGFYFPEVLRHVEKRIGDFKDEQISDLIDILLSFPIKKRIFKKRTINLLTNECLSRKIDEKILMKIEGIAEKDEKLKLHFEKILQPISLVSPI